MTFLPVVAREMSILARRRGTYRARVATAVAAVITLSWFLATSSQLSMLKLGHAVFVPLSYVGFIYALLAGLHATTDCISEEKREGTLGLLFLTDLRPHDIILGKLSAGSLNAAYCLMTIVPVISFSLLFGGITLLAVGKLVLVLLNTLFFSLGLGVLVSTLAEDERRAIFAASVTLFLVTVGPLVCAYAFSGLRSEVFLAVSPLYPMFALMQSRPFGVIGQFWAESVILHHVLAWICLITACLLLSRFINQVPGTRWEALRRWFESYTYGNRQARAVYRARLLDRNPFLWLVSRERAKAQYAWLFTALLLGLYFWLFQNFRHLFFDLPVSIAIIITIHFTLKLWIASEVCQRLIQDRKAGALELMLTTPLTVRTIARGQTLALHRIFLWPVLVIVAAELVLGYFAYQNNVTRTPPIYRGLTYAVAAGTLLLDAWALKWVGLWLSLWMKSVERALWTTLVRVLALPCIIFVSLYAVWQVHSFLSGSSLLFGTKLLLWAATGVVCSLALGTSARLRFLKYFRACAAGRFEGGKPFLEERTEPDEPAPAWWRPKVAAPVLRRAAFAGGAVLLVALFWGTVGRKLYWEYRLNSQVARVRAAGYPASMNELDRQLAASRVTASNAANLFSARMPSNKDNHLTLAENFLRGGLGQLPGRWENEAFATVVQANERQIKAFWQLTNCSTFGLPVSATTAFGPYQFVAAGVPLYATLGCVDYLVAVREGNMTRAHQTLSALLSFVRLLRATPVAREQYWASETLTKLIRVLEMRSNLPDAMLADLISQLEEMDNDAVLAPTIAASRAFFLETTARGLALHLERNNPSAAVWLWMVTGTFHKELSLGADAFETGLRFAELPWPDRLGELRQWHPFEEWNVSHARVAMAERSQIAQMICRHAEVTAKINILKTALGLRRYLMDHAAPPETAKSLVPRYLKEAPLDPFDGEVIRIAEPPHRSEYRGRVQRVIYSAGPDQDDQGGEPSYGLRGDIVLIFR